MDLVYRAIDGALEAAVPVMSRVQTELVFLVFSADHARRTADALIEGLSTGSGRQVQIAEAHSHRPDAHALLLLRERADCKCDRGNQGGRAGQPTSHHSASIHGTHSVSE